MAVAVISAGSHARIGSRSTWPTSQNVRANREFPMDCDGDGRRGGSQRQKLSPPTPETIDHQQCYGDTEPFAPYESLIDPRQRDEQGDRQGRCERGKDAVPVATSPARTIAKIPNARR